MLSRIRLWLDERWPFSYLLHLAFDEEIPGGSRLSYTLGSALITVFMLQAVTGIFQLFYFVPTIDHAYDSVSFLRTKVPFGWLINGIHYWGANAMVILVALHMTRVFVWGAYKHPRELTWLFGTGILLVVMGMSFTGGPLSWDQRAYWEAEVGTSIPGSIPVAGDMIKRILRGGEEMGQLTLSRLFIIHTAIFPATLIILIIAHLIAFRRFGSVGPWDEAIRSLKGRFWPDQVFKDALIAVLIILALVTLSVFSPKPFNGQADPLDSFFIPKPEWNFLFLYEALKFFPGRLEPIGAAGIPQLLILLLVLLPFIDRRPERNPQKRPVAMACGITLAGILIALSVAGYYSKPEGTESAPSPQATTARSLSAGALNGEQLFRSRGCVACHRVNNAGGTIGPDLSAEGLRGRTGDWLTTQIRDPRAHFPGTVMPAYTALTDKEVTDLVDYLLSLKNQPAHALTQAPDVSDRLSALRQTSRSSADINTKIPEKVFPSKMQPGPAADIIGSAERGAVLFKNECASCHGHDGNGEVPNPGSTDVIVPPLNPIDKELFSSESAAFAANIDKFIQNGSVPEGPAPKLSMPAFGDTNSLTQQQISNAEAYILQLNGISRAQLENPGMIPERFFMIVVPGVILVLLILGGIYKCLP